MLKPASLMWLTSTNETANCEGNLSVETPPITPVVEAIDILSVPTPL